MSDGPHGHGWWQASDQKWYPPERHPNYVASLPPPPENRSSAGSSVPGRLTEAERNQILNGAITALTGGVVVGTDAYGNPFARRTGPHIRRQGTTWAEIWYEGPWTHPGLILLHAILAVLTCGLYLPWWFYKTFKKPGVYTLAIDEYGNQSRTQATIGVAQRVQCVIVGIVMIWWLWKIVIPVIGLFQTVTGAPGVNG
jgi:hypothetical protein